MFSFPEYGYTNFSIGDVKYSLSNVFSDVPIDWLEKSIYGLKTSRPFTIYGWCEPEDIFCTVTENFCYVIYAMDDKIFKTHAIKVTMLDFCKMLHEDISRDTFAWAYFEYYGDEFEGDEYKELHLNDEKKIKSLLNELDALIKKRLH